MRLMLLALLAGCTRSVPPTSTVATVGDPVPDFDGVLAQTGEARTRADLVGQPTVVWFFPFAGTPG